MEAIKRNPYEFQYVREDLQNDTLRNTALSKIGVDIYNTSILKQNKEN